MPTLTRFLAVIVILAAIAFGVVWSLATFVRPTQVEQRIDLPVADLMARARDRDLIGPRLPEVPAAASARDGADGAAARPGTTPAGTTAAAEGR